MLDNDQFDSLSRTRRTRMPTYDYVCDACGHKFELFQSINDKLLKKCPECKKSKLRRLFGTGAAVVFKGSGFYHDRLSQRLVQESRQGRQGRRREQVERVEIERVEVERREQVRRR